MMMFRQIHAQLISILTSYAGTSFRVIGSHTQSKDVSEIKDNSRLVQVYYSDGTFNANKSGRNGPKQHEVKFNIDLSVAAAAQGDLTVLDNPASTFSQKAAAIAAIKEAVTVADEKVDELIELVFQIIMDSRHDSLLLGRGVLGSRFIDTIKKDTLLDRGELVIKTANMVLSMTVAETVTGVTPVTPLTVTIDSDITGDVESSGVSVANDNS